MRKRSSKLLKKTKKKTIDNIEIEYLEKYYICSECGSVVFDKEMWDYNVREGNNKLREKRCIITTDEINEILKKYAIGKKTLAKVLNMEEVNILRYLDGKNPSKEFSDKLNFIKDNPLAFEMMLLDKKNQLTPVAFKKSLGKVKQLEFYKEKSKLYFISTYIVNKLDEITSLPLQKLLYFVDGFYQAFYNKSLFNESPQAWIHVPVYKDIYDAFSYYGYEKINSEEILNNLDIKLEKEEEDIRKYFKKICREYNIKELDDIKKYSEDLKNKASKILFV